MVSLFVHSGNMQLPGFARHTAFGGGPFIPLSQYLHVRRRLPPTRRCSASTSSRTHRCSAAASISVGRQRLRLVISLAARSGDSARTTPGPSPAGLLVSWISVYRARHQQCRARSRPEAAQHPRSPDCSSCAPDDRCHSQQSGRLRAADRNVRGQAWSRLAVSRAGCHKPLVARSVPVNRPVMSHESAVPENRSRSGASPGVKIPHAGT